MYRFFSLLSILVVCASAAHGQHSMPNRPLVDPSERRPNSWTALLIDAISEGTGVEAWKSKEVMRLRIEIKSDERADADAQEQDASAAADEVGEPGEAAPNDEASSEVACVSGLVSYDLRERAVRFDFQDGVTLLAGAEGIAIWRRGDDSEVLRRKDISEEVIGISRALRYLLVLPLWLDEKDGIFAPGGLRKFGDQHYYSSAFIVYREDDAVNDAAPDDEANDAEGAAAHEEAHDGTSPHPRQDDWFTFFSGTRQPHRLEAVAFAVYDRSKERDERTQPRLIVFDDFEEVEGVQFAHTWHIHQFDQPDRPGRKIGMATLGDVEFVDRDSQRFRPPANALRIP